MSTKAPHFGLRIGSPTDALLIGPEYGPQTRGPTSREDSSLSLDLSLPVTYVIPTSSAQFNAIGVPVPTHCWKFDVASGSVFRDLIGGTLPLDTFMGGQLAFQQTAAGIWNGADAVSERCVEFVDTQTTVATNTTGSALLDIGLTGSAIAIGFLLRSVGRPGPAQRSVFSKRGSGADRTGWNIRTGITNNSLVLQVTSSDGFTNKQQNSIFDRAWHVAIVTIDRFNQLVNIVSDNAASSETSIATHPTLTNTGSLTVGKFGVGILGAPDYGFQVAAAWAWTGSVVPQISANDMTYPRAMLGVGKDPTGRLPVQCFTASMTVPVGSTAAGLQYVTYHGNAYSQLPFSYDARFSHTSKMGLTSVRSAINYITSSDEMHVWQASDGATVGARTSSPAGMVTAELLDGAAFPKTRYFTVGGTAGTLVSGYSLIRASSGTATGRLIIYNSTSALTASIIAATSFTASTAWDRYEVTATLPGPATTAVSYAIEYNAAVYVWRNTFVSGSPTAVVYSSASLGSMHRTQYLVTGSAGSLVKSARGKVRAKVACENDTGQLTRQILAAEYGGGNANRVSLQLTGSSVDQLRGEVRDSNGTLAAAVQTAAVTASGEHDVEWEWDNTGKPIEVQPGSSRLRDNGVTYLGPQDAWSAADTTNTLWLGSDVSGSNQLQGILARVSASYRTEMI